MKKSDSIAKIAAALVKFNSEVGRIAKDAKNPHFKNNYATYDQLIDACRPILAQNGISVLQFPSGDEEGRVIITTMLMHESGEWIESDPLIMKPVKADPQGVGSCITYAKRYSLAAILSLSTGADDDGNAASFVGQSARQSHVDNTRQPLHEQTYSEHEQIPGVDGQLVTPKVEAPSQKAAALWSLLGKDTSKLAAHVEKQIKLGYSMTTIEKNLAKEVKVPESIAQVWLDMYAGDANKMQQLQPWYVQKRLEGMTDEQIEVNLANAIAQQQSAAAK